MFFKWKGSLQYLQYSVLSGHSLSLWCSCSLALINSLQEGHRIIIKSQDSSWLTCKHMNSQFLRKLPQFRLNTGLVTRQYSHTDLYTVYAPKLFSLFIYQQLQITPRLYSHIKPIFISEISISLQAICSCSHVHRLLIRRWQFILAPKLSYMYLFVVLQSSILMQTTHIYISLKYTFFSSS